jgi:ABC-type branched-subunit amino acid transport system substrate-binding protein
VKGASAHARLWLGLAAALALSACRLAGPGGAEPAGRTSVVLAPGPISVADQAEARRLYRSAEASFAARRFFEVLRTVADLTERFPASDVSGDALLLGARAELALGAGERADAMAERYLALLEPEDPRQTAVRLLQVDAWAGSAAMQLDRLLRIRTFSSAEERERAEAAARSAVAVLSAEELETVLGAASAEGALAPIPLAWQSVHLLERGDEERAAALARSVLDRAPPEPERFLADGVTRGELPEGRRRARSFDIATILPLGGPPALAEFARQIAEGIEVAAATVLGGGFQVKVRSLDDEGDTTLGALLMAQLDSTGVLGVIGFLEEEALVAAGQARKRGVPIVSPTARSTEGAGEGVYSLEGPDPEAAAAIARYAAHRGFQRVAIIVPERPHAYEEAGAFQAVARSLGIPVVGRFAYPSGATFFEREILGARDALRAAEIAALGLGPEDTLRAEMLEPVGLFLPIPPEDVEYLAPQLAHFGLDTLAIELLGTSGWTDPRILGLLQPRYTDGVVATAPDGASAGFPGMARFREAYEQHFQRSLISSTPAIGYDATLVLLEGLRSGLTAPADVRAAIERIRNIQGATGTFSVVGSRVVRRTSVVRIENRRLVPVALVPSLSAVPSDSPLPPLGTWR